MRSYLALVACVASAILIQPVRTLCYFPNGNIAGQDTPCRDSTTQSTCCGQGYACLSNNMCMATGKELAKNDATLYVRGSCTDKTWRSSECPLFCADPNADNVGGGEGLGQCENNSTLFYCIDSNGHDCEKQQNVLFFQEVPTAYTTIGVNSITSTISTSGPIPTISTPSNSLNSLERSTFQASSAALTPTLQSSKDETSLDSSVTKVRVGVGVGVGVGVAALIALLAVWILLRRRKSTRNNTGSALQNYGQETSYMETNVAKGGLQRTGNHTCRNADEVFEAPADAHDRRYAMRHELPGA